MEVSLHSFLTSVLDGEALSLSCSGRFSWGQNPGTHWIGGWVDPRAGLDVSLVPLMVFAPLTDQTIT